MLHNNPQISVILPTYNRSEELKIALQSLQAQTYRHFEAVIINDGSLDLDDIVHNSGLVESGITVRYLNERSDTGPSAARNRGLAVATGDVVAYLDDDDVFGPEHLALHAEQYASPDVHVVYSDANRCIVGRDADGNAIEKTELVHSRDYDPDALLVANYIPMLCLSHRRECLDKSGVFEESLTSLVDWDLFTRLSAHYDFLHLPEITATYFEQESGTSVQTRNRNRFVDNLKMVYKRTEALMADDEKRRNRVWKMRLKNMAKMMFDTGMHFESNGDPQEALTHYTSAAETHPDPAYYMAMARTQKTLGLKKEALVSMHMAQYCLDPENAEST